MKLAPEKSLSGWRQVSLLKVESRNWYPRNLTLAKRKLWDNNRTTEPWRKRSQQHKCDKLSETCHGMIQRVPKCVQTWKFVLCLNMWLNDKPHIISNIFKWKKPGSKHPERGKQKTIDDKTRNKDYEKE